MTAALPSVAERSWLMSETAALIARAGLEPYVAAPLVEPTDRYFPDEWHPDEGGVARLARRVLDHAGLGEVAIDVSVSDEAIAEGIAVTALAKDSVQLAADRDHLDDPLALIATLARIAAATLRARAELVDAVPDQEARCIDVATVYLGFGLITTNAAYRYRASGERRGYTAITRWKHTRLGALSPEAMAYLLAVQQAARDASSKEIRAIVRQLETNQATFFEAAYTELATDVVARELALPDRATWPARRAPPPETEGQAAKFLRALAAPAPALPTAVAVTAPSGGNAGQPVFRALRTRAMAGGFIGLMGSMVPVIIASVNGFGGLALAALAGVPLLGMLAGRRLRRHVCAGRGCEQTLPDDAERCASCGGRIAGTLLPGENRLEAEERLQLTSGDNEIDVGEPDASV